MRQRYSLTLLVRHISRVLGVFVLVALFGIQVKPASAESSALSPAFVRVVHASPDIGTADVFVDGTRVLSNFAFGTFTPYVTIPPGPHRVQVALIGKGIGASIITQTLTVSSGVAYTVAGLGTKQTGFSLEGFIDDNVISNGLAKVRIYHLSPGSGMVSVAAGGNTLVSGLAYQQASNYLSIPAGPYTFNVTASVDPNAPLPDPATLKSNTVTSVFAVGVFNGNPKLQFVNAQVPGLPKLPQTGSDPNPISVPGGNSQPVTPWLFVILALTLFGSGVTVHRFSRTR